jgi:hypothetical protein
MGSPMYAAWYAVRDARQATHLPSQYQEIPTSDNLVNGAGIGLNPFRKSRTTRLVNAAASGALFTGLVFMFSFTAADLVK